MAVRGVVLYELVCTECGSVTPAITSAERCADLDEPLVCGHDPIRRDLWFVERAPTPDSARRCSGAQPR